jgi:fluoroacetyl-CoA thioesterase
LAGFAWGARDGCGTVAQAARKAYRSLFLMRRGRPWTVAQCGVVEEGGARLSSGNEDSANRSVWGATAGMNTRPKVGSTGELAFVVEAKHAIEFASDGLPSVLSTPHLIGFMERTARQTLAPWLEPGEQSVGIEIDMRHLAATPVGNTVHCVARIIRSEGAEVSFQVEARDHLETIARGVHKRHVIRVAGFARRVREKSESRRNGGAA